MASSPGGLVSIIDVRKPAARAASGLAIPGALWRHPFDAANWADEFTGRQVAVYCVHGHEVSQAVRGFLTDLGMDAMSVEGGFEGWRQAGLPVEPVDDRHA
ncbi:MAG: hypothetical protein VR78_07200 [Hoeflea sp. BRH_c9]|nr:MAG: hypothetical protein VR78_07200 [Hoeflea sp. BRH_c9]